LVKVGISPGRRGGNKPKYFEGKKRRRGPRLMGANERGRER